MNITKEVVLFFKDGLKCDPLDIAKELKLRFNDIGEPIILPLTKDKKYPIIIFKENEDFYVQVSNYSANVILKSDFNNLSSIIFDLVDAFEDNNCLFNRIGYVTTYFMNNDSNNIRNSYLNMEKYDEDITAYNIATFKELNMKKSKINAWERIINNENGVIFQYDINSISNEEISFSMKYIKEFINVSNTYIEERVKNV